MSRAPRTAGRIPWLQRSRRGAILGGVCAGLGHSLGVDPTLLRLALLVLCLAWGLGLVLYVLLWVALPLEGTQVKSFRWRARRTLRSMPDELSRTRRHFAAAWERSGRSPWPRPANRRWVALGLAGTGVVLFLGTVGAFEWITPLRATGIGLVVAGAAVLTTVEP